MSKWVEESSRWIWNYLTLINIEQAKCNICNKLYKTRTNGYKSSSINEMKDHIKSEHENIYKTILIHRKGKCKDEWPKKYRPTQCTTNTVLKLKCQYCPYLMTPRMILDSRSVKFHLRHTHKITQSTSDDLYVYLVNNEYYDLNMIEPQQSCKKCRKNIKSNLISLLKHLIDDHHHNVPTNIIPKGLRDTSTSNRNEDIALNTHQQSNRLEVNNISDGGPTDLEDIEIISNQLTSNQPSSDPRGTPSTNRQGSSEEPPYKRQKLNENNSNNEEDD